MHANAPRQAARTLASAALAIPALLLVAGCSSGPGDDGAATGGPSPTASASASPVKFQGLPDPCTTVSGGTVKDVVPNARSAKGKSLASTDTDSYGACLWSGGHGKNDASYRALTVSLKRYDSDASLGSGDEQARRYFRQEVESVTGDKANKDLAESEVQGVGQQAVALAYQTEKGDEGYRVHRIVALLNNVVATIDHEGAGFGDADLPSAGDLEKHAEKVAKEALAALG